MNHSLLQTETGGTKISPQESMRSQYKPSVQVSSASTNPTNLSQTKANTLPANSAAPKK